MAKIVPTDIVNGTLGDNTPGVSNLDVDYDVKIEMIALSDEWDVSEQAWDADPKFDCVPRMYLKLSRINMLGPNDKREFLNADVYTIEHSRLGKYIPSRVYWDEQRQNFVLLYYTSPLIKIAPFTDNGVVHCFAIPLDPNYKIVYDVRARVFIDQVMTPQGMMCFFIFGDDSYDYIISPKM